MKLVFISVLLLATFSACTPIRSTAKTGYKTARVATKTAWAVGKVGTSVATSPLRMGGSGDDSSSNGGRRYTVRGRTYHVMTSNQTRGFRETGTASYYSDGRTASGERLSSNSMTAAHKTLPFGTRVRVTNLSNGKSIVVRINDRGPFVNGRVIDVTKRGADQLGFRKQGIAKVKLEVI